MNKDGGEQDASLREFRRALEAMQSPQVMGNAEQFEAAAFTLLKEAAAHAETHPSPDKDLEDRLSESLDSADWASALTHIDRLIQVATERGETHMMFVRRKRKAEILEALGQTAAALQEARAATAVARQDPDFTALISMGLDLESDLAWESGDAAAALALSEEAIEICRRDGRSELAVSRLLIVGARSHISLGNLEAARKALDDAFPAVNRLADGLILAGAQSSLARWHEAMAGWHRARGEYADAIQQHGLALTRRRIVFETSHITRYLSASALARSLRKLADLVEESGDLGRAGELLDEARRILEAERLPDPSRPD